MRDGSIHFRFTILLLLSSQLMGLGFGGVSRRFLVWPASLVWPYNLVIATNLNTFHAEDDAKDGRMTRFRFFMIAFCSAFAYYFLPGMLAWKGTAAHQELAGKLTYG